MVLLGFALSDLKEFKLMVVGSLLNLRSSAFHMRIAVLLTSLNQGELVLFEGDVFVMAFFAIEFRVSMKCFVWFGLISLFNGISTFVGYLMPKLFS